MREAQEDLTQLDIELGSGVEAETIFNVAFGFDCSDTQRFMRDLNQPARAALLLTRGSGLRSLWRESPHDYIS